MKFEPMMSGSKLVSTAVPLHSFALTLYTIDTLQLHITLNMAF